MSKKFLLISQVFYPDQVSTANLFTGLCTMLAEENIEVEVWSAHPSYTNFIRQPRRVLYKGINIIYLPSTNINKNSLAGRSINILTFMISASLKLLFSKEKNPVWALTNPPFLGILLSHICSLKKRKFIYVLLDIFPEGLVRLGKVSGENIFIKLWQRLFILALKKSEIIIVIGRDTKQFVVNLCPECHDKIEYIPHWQNDDLIFPVDFDKNNFVSERGLKESFVVQYSGNIGIWNEVRTMGRAVKKNIENVFFIFVGGGIRKPELLSEFEIKKQKNVMMLPFQNNIDFNNIMAASHVHLVTLKQGLEGMAVPCKIYGILAAGRPVIALVPANSEIAYLVREENCGLVVNPDDLDGLINAISFLKDNEDIRSQMGQNGRDAFEKKYTARIAAKEYKKILDKVT
jgi:glycosyltransferase involved in cell wall biosynthesis